MADDPGDTRRQLRAAREGDKQALNDLLERYLPRVRRIAAARLGRALAELVEVDDIVQESLLDAFQGIDRVDCQSEGVFTSWLANLVANNVRDAGRRARAKKRGAGQVQRFADLEQSSLSDSVFGADVTTPSQRARAHETEERLEAALLRLGPRHREVVALHAFGQMGWSEIASVMGLVSETSARLLFLRARDKLRELVDQP